MGRTKKKNKADLDSQLKLSFTRNADGTSLMGVQPPKQVAAVPAADADDGELCVIIEDGAAAEDLSPRPSKRLKPRGFVDEWLRQLGWLRFRREQGVMACLWCFCDSASDDVEGVMNMRRGQGGFHLQLPRLCNSRLLRNA